MPLTGMHIVDGKSLVDCCAVMQLFVTNVFKYIYRLFNFINSFFAMNVKLSSMQHYFTSNKVKQN